MPCSDEVLALRLHTLLALRSAQEDAQSSQALLSKMLPQGVITRLKDGQSLIAQSLDNVTILFSDIVSFTTLAAELATTDLILMINELFSAFDALVDTHGCQKVETIGDAYMVVAGHDGSPDHAARVLALAGDMLAAAATVRTPTSSGDGSSQEADGQGHVRVRIGVHSGPAFAGVVGTKVPRFILRRYRQHGIAHGV